jgi:hypothetical protein
MSLQKKPIRWGYGTTMVCTFVTGMYLVGGAPQKSKMAISFLTIGVMLVIQRLWPKAK